MKKNILQYILPFNMSQFSTGTFIVQYEEWEKPTRQIQIFASAFLTSLLYICFSLLDKSWAPEKYQAMMQIAHLLIILPILLVISYLSHKRLFYHFVMFALALAPVIAVVCHAYIAIHIGEYSPYQMEGYMVIFWTFIMSGLTFRYALISAVCSSFILIVSAYFFMGMTDFFSIHVFWILCSFSFGFLAALIFDKSRKAIFISHQELHELAITDTLTGVFNRNQLNHVLREEIDEFHRMNRSFGLLILDVDHFKKVNDTLGHDEGDRVLKQIALHLSKLMNENDTLIRWGGEEFIVVVPDVNEQDLLQRCEKIRKQLASKNFGAAANLTVSIGATLFSISDTQDVLISRADKALYLAKEKGRNNSVFIK